MLAYIDTGAGTSTINNLNNLFHTPDFLFYMHYPPYFLLCMHANELRYEIQVHASLSKRGNRAG